MAPDFVTFSQVVAKAQGGTRANNDETEGFGKRQTPVTRPEPVAEAYIAPGDRKPGDPGSSAIAGLQDAMDLAIKAGLIVEPDIKSVSSRFNEFGVSVDS